MFLLHIKPKYESRPWSRQGQTPAGLRSGLLKPKECFHEARGRPAALNLSSVRRTSASEMKAGYRLIMSRLKTWNEFFMLP